MPWLILKVFQLTKSSPQYDQHCPFQQPKPILWPLRVENRLPLTTVAHNTSSKSVSFILEEKRKNGKKIYVINLHLSNNLLYSA